MKYLKIAINKYKVLLNKLIKNKIKLNRQFLMIFLMGLDWKSHNDDK